MAKAPAGRKPAPTASKSAPAKKPAAAKKPAPVKMAAGIGAPARRRPAATAKPRAEKPVKVQPAPVLEQAKGLTPKQQRFVDEYLIDLNATQAAIRAGYSEDTAQEQGSRLLSNVMVSSAVTAARARIQERTGITADRVVQEAWRMVTADARELTSLTYHACRHCHGERGLYQWRNPEEYEKAVASRIAENRKAERRGDPGSDLPLPSDAGGYGYTRLLPVNPSCPACDGEGLMRVKVNDTRNLSPEAVAIFAGIKQTKEGLEVKTHSKDAALEKLFKHLGLYEADNSQKAPSAADVLAGVASAEIMALRERVARALERKKQGGA